MTAWDAIPAELREQPRWVVWRWGDLDPKTGKRKKPPTCAHDLRRRGSSTRAETWSTFEQAVSIVETGKADGIGFALCPPWVGVDLDDELPEADRGAILGTLDSYSETSVSGTGYHVVLRGSLNGRGRHPMGIGVFQTDRFFYFSGEHVRGTPDTIEDRQEELDRVLAHFLPTPELRTAVQSSAVEPVDLDDRELLDRARRARNGDDFDRLYNGDTGGYPSHSEADLALCGMLSFWTGRDAARIDRLFRSSGLMREKWERADYRQRTIDAAIASTTDVYRMPSELRRPSNAVDAVGAPRGASAANCATASTDRRSSSGEAEHPSAPDLVRQEEEADAVAPDSVPFAVPLDEFIATKTDAPPGLVGDDDEIVVPAAGLVLLVSRGGKGKTTMTVEALLHFASGREWLGFVVPRPLRVLLVENEGPREPFRRKLEIKRELWPHEIAGAVFVQTFNWGGFTLADDVHVKALRAFIEREQIDLVMGDPLDSLGIEGVGSPEDTRKFMQRLGEAGLFQDVAFWLLHHPHKREADDELDEASGAWGGKPDTMLKLTKLEGNRARLSFPKLRWSRRGTRKALILAFDPDTEAFSVVGEEQDEEREYLAEIIALLEDGKHRTAKEIAAPKPTGIGANDSTVKELLDQHPDVFRSCNGGDVGRSKLATVWTLRGELRICEITGCGFYAEPGRDRCQDHLDVQASFEEPE